MAAEIFQFQSRRLGSAGAYMGSAGAYMGSAGAYMGSAGAYMWLTDNNATSWLILQDRTCQIFSLAEISR